MKLIAAEVNKIIHNVFKKKHPVLGEIIINWEKIVGTKFNNNTVPFRIITVKELKKTINILYINAENASIGLELSYQVELLIERIAIYLGYKAIHKIKIFLKN